MEPWHRISIIGIDKSPVFGLCWGQPVNTNLLLHSDGGTFEPISTATLSVSLLHEGEVLGSSEINIVQ